MILNKAKQDHYDGEKDTAALVKFCYQSECAGDKLTPKKLYALCKLTWYDTIFFTRAERKYESLWAIWDKNDDLPSIKEAEELSKYGFPTTLIALAKKDTGIVRLYGAFRNSSYIWIEKHFNLITPLVQHAATLKSDNSARKLVQQINGLPGIPKPSGRGGKLSPSSLLTPVFACLDPRGRFPIINKNDNVIKLHKKLDITYSSLADKFDALIAQIGKHGIKDALMLDVCSSDLADQLLKKVRQRRNPKSAHGPGPLTVKGENDVTVLIKQRTRKARRLHNMMTNCLRKHCDKAGVEVSQQRYDAFISNYKKGRDLLIEAKSSIDRPPLRLAVGQLFDYQRGLPRRAVTDLAVLLPSKPSSDSISYLSDVGIYALWFRDAKFDKLGGNIDLGFVSVRRE
jgi:hypothetical protein